MGGGGHLAASGCSRAIPIAEMAKEAITNMQNQVNSFFGAREK
jgi:nanoRNase/pAp phosphatase (c-di-AMP/oligoRNAs hydrolase)